jgi:hypothetical protein
MNDSVEEFRRHAVRERDKPRTRSHDQLQSIALASDLSRVQILWSLFWLDISIAAIQPSKAILIFESGFQGPSS